ncbi:MAG: hypothetical protein FWF59_09215 [Turicibacter sp.]|nr:hypothetical protein [Turicibacter sp.]
MGNKWMKWGLGGLVAMLFIFFFWWTQGSPSCLLGYSSSTIPSCTEWRLPRPSEPNVRDASFDIRLTYEVGGETHVVEDTFWAMYHGVRWEVNEVGDGQWISAWRYTFENGQPNDVWVELFRDEEEAIVLDLGQFLDGLYLVGGRERNNALGRMENPRVIRSILDNQPLPGVPSRLSEELSTEELWEDYGIVIVSVEHDPRLEGDFD